jgi:asparagine synthase (glutamine-hydrolysing)
MCGFAGYLFNRKTPIDATVLREAGDSLRHRGPDYCGLCQMADFGCVHTRLSIVDLSSAGNQPFTDGRYVLVYNGEIYNHLELRRELEGEKIEFRGSSDTASLFAYLIRFGVPAALRKARGMFAFAFYDSREKRVFLGRDRYGIKPLFWSLTPEGLAWASEVKALRPFLKIEPDPVKTLFGLFGVVDQSFEQTAFRNVRQLAPGHCLEYALGGEPRITEYYNLTSQVDAGRHRELSKLPDDEIVKRFVSLLTASTRSMLMSDAPMGAFVSGGIDSSLIASTASPEQSHFKLFTADVIGPYSEYKDACMLAQHLQRELKASHFHPGQMIEDWARCTWHYEAPIVTHTNSIPFASVARVARAAGVKAILSGEGSDELFLGYPRLLTSRYDGLIKLPLRAVQLFYRLMPRLATYVEPPDDLKGFAGLLVRNFEHQRLRERARPAFDFLSRARGDEQYRTVDMFASGLPALLHRNDRMGMSASIEARFPFLNEDVVHFALNLPMKWKIGRVRRFHNYKHPFLEDKAIVRAAARRLLPRELVQKRKMGFPMLGHKFIRVQTGFFRNGFVWDALGLDTATEEYMIKTQVPYFVAKLVSVEVFGRLFGWGQSCEQVSEHLQKWVGLKAEPQAVA